METVVRSGFVPVITPALVRERTMEEAGFFPTDRNQVYELPENELFLLGTSEVALSALHREETLTPDQLPARYAGYSTCFRREAGTYGKDTAASSACTSSTRSRCSRSPRPTRRTPSTSSSFRSKKRFSVGSACRIASSISQPVISVPRRRRSSTSKCGCRRRASTAKPRRARTIATTPRGGSARGEGREGFAALAHAERHCVRGEPHARVSLRALSNAGRRLHRARSAAPLHRFRFRPPADPRRYPCARRGARAAEWDGLENR